MSLFGGSSSKSTTNLSETNTDNSLANNQSQNLIGGGGSVGASDFGSAVTIGGVSKGSAEVWDITDGIVINKSSGTYSFNISTPPQTSAITPEVLQSYIGAASEEQILQTNAKTSELMTKVGGAVAALTVILWLLKK